MKNTQLTESAEALERTAAQRMEEAGFSATGGTAKGLLVPVREPVPALEPVEPPAEEEPLTAGGSKWPCRTGSPGFS
jgi:hypothetical protein